MKYISESILIEFWIKTIEFSTTNKLSSNKFFGVLELFRFINTANASLTPNLQYSLISSQLSESLQEKYFFDESTYKNFNSDDQLYLMLSNNWQESISQLLLKNLQIPLEWVAALCLQNESFNDTTVSDDICSIFIEKYNIKSVEEIFFNRLNSKISLSSTKPNRNNIFTTVKKYFGLTDNEKFTLGFEKNLIQANPGEITRGPFIQPLYSGQENLKSLILSTFKFTEYYNISSNSPLVKEKANENIIIEKQKLKWIIFNTFKHLFDNYGEKKLLEGIEIKESTIDKKTYTGISLPKYFATDILIGQFPASQSKENLTSSSTQRFFDENFMIYENEFSYFTTQWSDVDGLGRTLNNFNKYLSDISNDSLRIIKRGELYDLIGRKITLSKLSKPENIIYYGAPGTGKSYKINQILKPLDSKFYERITFHPEFDNASFVGGYKPISEKIAGQDVIKYKFIPQAFTNIYERAWSDLNNQYYLAIEEINRGNCAEIFGDVFQLLDRNSDYTVSPSNELQKHLIEKLGEEHDGIINGLKLPQNLSLLASMNTSDQSLFPMDSAFKRRWGWEYIPICYEEKTSEGKDNESFNYVVILDEKTSFKWIEFIEAVNYKIKNNPNLGMDKCIGNYFIKSETKEISLKEFINKAIFYLWNDVFKDEDNSDSVFEKGTSYEDFFPINTKGTNEVEKILKSLAIQINS